MKGRNKMKKVKKLTIILTIVLLCLASFAGIYVQKHSMMENIIKDYDFGMNIEGYREVRMKVSKDQEVTSEKVETVKKLLEARLKELGAQDYLIKVDYVTGEIVLELEEAYRTDKIVGDVYTAGEVKMADSKDTSKVFMTNADIKQASLKYNTTEAGTGIYLDLEFTEEGAKKIEDLSSNEYKTLPKEESEENVEEKTEEQKKEEEDKQPKLAFLIDGNQLVASSFDFPISGGRIQLALNAATTNQDLIQEAVNTGVALSTVINNGPLPLKYELTANTYVYSEITNQVKMVFGIAIAVVIVIALAVLVVKYKMSAVFAGISYIGFIALYLLVLRYANVVITLEGVAGILVILIINYLLTQKILEEDYIIDAAKEMGIQLIPVIAVIVAFSFIAWTNIASFGMTMFWGIVLTAIYHFVVTKALLEK